MEIGSLHLKPLRQDQYRQVADWEYGPQENVDWDRYTAEMNAPDLAHFGLYDGADFVGCVTFEGNRTGIAYHVVTARRKVHPLALAQILLKTAGEFFDLGYTAMVARIPTEKRAAVRLAIRCGMFEYGHCDKMRYFILTKAGYLRNGRR